VIICENFGWLALAFGAPVFGLAAAFFGALATAGAAAATGAAESDMFLLGFELGLKLNLKQNESMIK
jgi:hypothetical protein